MGHTLRKRVEQMDGVFSYTVGIAALFFAFFLANASVIMTIGGFIVLCMRLYVDGKRFYRELTRKDKANDD